MADEAERSIHEALSVLSQTVKEARVTLGGGCVETLMNCAVDNEAKRARRPLPSRHSRMLSVSSLRFWRIMRDMIPPIWYHGYVQPIMMDSPMLVLASSRRLGAVSLLLTFLGRHESRYYWVDEEAGYH